jgi:Asp-tRNA(Asn)/Glu-tRNA(Gln) amidotransferase A subunit family amidase
MTANSLPPSTIEGEPLDPFGAMLTRVEPARDSSGPLQGIRFCVKDNIGVAGQPFTAGHPLFSERTASFTAPAVLRTADLGADFVGMTRTDSGGFGVTTPGVRNPRYPNCIVGGSSGGAAAAVAAGLADFALGTDTGGSVRIPAACAGLFGFKPTYGSLSTTGVWPLAPSYDHVGLLARELPLLRRVVELLLPNGLERKAQGSSMSRCLTIAVEQNAPRYEHPMIASWFETLVRAMEERGHQINRVQAPDRHAFTGAFGVMVLSEAERVYADLIPLERELLGAAAQRALAIELTPRDYQLARDNIDSWRQQYMDFLKDADVLLSPAMFIPPPPPNRHSIEAAGCRWSLLQVLMSGTCFCNVLGSPALVMPVENPHIPLGLHLTARRGFDLNLLEIAEQLTPVLRSATFDGL